MCAVPSLLYSHRQTKRITIQHISVPTYYKLRKHWDVSRIHYVCMVFKSRIVHHNIITSTLASGFSLQIAIPIFSIQIRGLSFQCSKDLSRSWREFREIIYLLNVKYFLWTLNIKNLTLLCECNIVVAHFTIFSFYSNVWMRCQIVWWIKEFHNIDNSFFFASFFHPTIESQWNENGWHGWYWSMNEFKFLFECYLKQQQKKNKTKELLNVFELKRTNWTFSSPST